MVRPSMMVRRRRGIAAVEFAMTFPIVALVLLSTLEFGWYFTQLQMVNSATYDAARDAADEGTMTAAAVVAESTAEVLLNDLGINCDVIACDIDAFGIYNGGIRMVELQVNVPYDQLTGIIPAGSRLANLMHFEAPDTLRARAVMPVVGP